MASLIGRVEDLIVEHRKVESKAKANWVGRCEIRLGHLGSILVSLERLVGRCATLVPSGKLSKVSMVVALPVLRCFISTVPRK
jgi:hypothetical protein